MLAKSTQAVGSVATNAGTATKNAFTKSTDTVGGWFGREKNAQETVAGDPLALSNTPDKVNPDVFVASGQLWESTGNVTKAMESYTQALQSDPNNGPALTSIARLHFREGNHPKAAEFFQKAIVQQPEDPVLFNDLGLTLSKLGQHDMAAQTISRALQLSPGTSRYANNLASVHFEAGKPDEALAVLSKHNKPAVTHFNMAYLYYKNGQAANAETHLRQAIAFEPQAAADPSIKRAVDMSRDMLAQILPGGVPSTGPASGPGVVPPGLRPGEQIAAAPGPIAQVAAAPAHQANAVPPGVENRSPAAHIQLPPSMGQPWPGTVDAKAVGYQDPRSYMLPQAPPKTPSAVKAGSTTAPAKTDPAAPPTTSFQMPPGITLPTK